MNQMLPVEDSFDIVQRDIQIGGKDATFYFIDGFTKDESMLKIMDSFFNIKEGDMPRTQRRSQRPAFPMWKWT